MGRAKMILITDDQGVAESAKDFARNYDCEIHVFSEAAWISQPEPATVLPFAKGSTSTDFNHSAKSSSVGATILQFPVGAGGGIEGRMSRMDQIESKAIENAIFEHNGNLTEAARALGIGRATLYRKVKTYKLDPDQARGRRKQAA